METAMKKLTMLASATALAFALAVPPALAQSYSYSKIMMADHSIRTSKLIGLPVVNKQGEKVGTIVDVLVKDSAAEPIVILSVGDFVGGGPKLVAAPLSHITFEKTHIMMAAATKQEIARMPAYDIGPVGGSG